MIITSKLGKQPYPRTVDIHIMYYLKIIVKLEPYLYKLATSNSINLSKFRCRSNNLPISEVYKHAEKYNIKCKIGGKNEIGGEFHNFFICPVFDDDR